MSRLTRRLVSCGQTHNQVIAALISLEKRITPEEREVVLEEIAQIFTRLGYLRRVELAVLDYVLAKGMSKVIKSKLLLRAQRLSALRFWSLNVAGHAGLSTGQPLQRYHRAWSRGGKILFQRAPQRRNTILVCFTDGQGRIMMSVADFLQAWQIPDADVLFLWPRSGSRFTAGISGYGPDLREGVLGLGKFLRDLGYSTQYVLGTSSGASAALLYGLLNGASRTLLAGPLKSSLDLLVDMPGDALVEKKSRKSLEPGQVTVFFGGDSDHDRNIAEQFAKNWGCRVVAVTDSTHVCLYPLLERAELAGALKDVFASKSRRKGSVS